MTPETIATLRRLLDNATARPWMVDDEGDDVAVIVDEGDEFSFIQIAADLHQGDNGLTDARLIVAAVNALPALLDAAAERDALAAKVERVRALHSSKCHKHSDPWGPEHTDPSCFEHCFECMQDGPCPTIRALDEEPQP